MAVAGRRPVTEDHQTRLKRLRLRSWRRGTREMDLILGPFADAHLADLDAAALDAYERLLEQNDWDLYYWITGARPVPADHGPLVNAIRQARGAD